MRGWAREHRFSFVCADAWTDPGQHAVRGAPHSSSHSSRWLCGIIIYDDEMAAGRAVGRSEGRSTGCWSVGRFEGRNDYGRTRSRSGQHKCVVCVGVCMGCVCVFVGALAHHEQMWPRGRISITTQRARAEQRWKIMKLHITKYRINELRFDPYMHAWCMHTYVCVCVYVRCTEYLVPGSSAKPNMLHSQKRNTRAFEPQIAYWARGCRCLWICRVIKVTQYIYTSSTI